MKTKWKLSNLIDTLFLHHPRSIGESYFQHLFFAMKFGLTLVISGLACILHSIFPFIFVNTASRTVQHLAESFQQRSDK